MENWFYVQDGNRVGPVSEEQLKTLHQAGAVEDDTLIWRKGLKEWQKYAEIFPPPPGKKAADLVTEKKKADPPAAPASAPKQAAPPSPQGKSPAVSPPPPPPEAMEASTADQAGASSEEKAAQPKASTPPSKEDEDDIAPAKVPKPIEGKGNADRWKSIGPTFSLAGSRDPEAETPENKEDKERTEEQEQEQEQPENGADAVPEPSKAPPEESSAPPAESDSGTDKPAPEPQTSSEAPSPLKLKRQEPEAGQAPPEKSPQPASEEQEKTEPPAKSGSGKEKPTTGGADADLQKIGKKPGAADLSIDGPSVERAICDECQKPFPVAMMDKFGRKWVCKLCQARLKEKYEELNERKRRRRGLFTGTFEKIMLVVVVVALLGAVLFSLRGRLGEMIEDGGSIVSASFAEELSPTTWSTLPPDQWPPLIMTNRATFANSSALSGGSAFLVKDENENVMGVTSSLLLNPDYGVYPPVHVADIPIVLGAWTMRIPTDPSERMRFTQLHGDPFIYLTTPAIYLDPEGGLREEYPVEVLRIQPGTPSEEEPVFVVALQPRRNTIVQTVYGGNIYPSSGGINVVVKLEETVSDAEVTGAPVLDSNGNVIGMIIGSKPFQGHMPIEDFQQFNYSDRPQEETRRRQDIQMVSKLYAIDVRALPEFQERE